MKRCAFLSMNDLSEYRCDDALAVPPLRALGWSVDIRSWCDTSVNWGDYELVVIRSPWDYQDRLDDFVATLRRIVKSGAVLANSLTTVEWNINKGYLSELAARGVATVPTRWGHTNELPDVEALFDALQCDEIVIKRVVGAGAKQAFRLRRGVDEHNWDQVRAIYADKDWMAQPFLDAVLDEGELSLCYFNGEFSHAIRKQPRAGDYRVQEEHGGVLVRVDPDTHLLAAADAVMASIGETLLYARVDLVRGNSGGYQLMELELIEPSLYFRLDGLAPGRFARALDQWWVATQN